MLCFVKRFEARESSFENDVIPDGASWASPECLHS